MKLLLDFSKWTFDDFTLLSKSFEDSDFDKAGEVASKVVTNLSDYDVDSINDLPFEQGVAAIKTIMESTSNVTENIEGNIKVNMKKWKWKDFHKWQKAVQNNAWDVAIPLMFEVIDEEIEIPLSFLDGLRLTKSITEATTKIFSGKN